MQLAGVPIVSLLRDKMQWHQARQRVLAENIANADTPGFKPRDLVAPEAGGAGTAPVGLDRTSPLHLASVGGDGAASKSASRFETRPSGNSVLLEDEMAKIGDNGSDYQLAATLYQKSLALLRSAAGVRGS